MPEHVESTQICPFLGLVDDRESRFSYPEAGHRCFSTDRETEITLEHQAAYCFSARYGTCSRFVDPKTMPAPAAARPASAAGRPVQRQGSPWLLIAGIVAGLIVVLAAFYYFGQSLFQQGPADNPTAPVAAAPTATPSPSPTPEAPTREPTPTPLGESPTPAPVALVASPADTPTPVPGGRIYTLSPAEADIGWLTSGEDRGNHFGDSFLYAGIFEGQVYNSAFQIDLSAIPRGAPILEATLQLTGLRDDRLGEDGTWLVRLLASEIDADWRRHNFQDIFNAPAEFTLTPILGRQDLAGGQPNTFELSPTQIELLQNRILEGRDPKVSFRLDGPETGPDNLFAWDSGYGAQTRGHKATLILNVGPPPVTPIPLDYVVVTSTPTPENVMTAAAIALQMTAEATRVGTATPTPVNVATATPFPADLVIVPTATPENEATAQALAAVATAQALTTGTPTPYPTNAVTASPTPSATPTPTYVLITSTPTPSSVLVAATMAAEATARVQRFGPPTPLPPNWVTPVVVTSTPTPINAATAEYLAAVATAQAFTTGTPTPTPANVVTATPTPVFVLLDGELPPLAATPTPTAPPAPIPAELIGKIAFKSDRSGEEEIYVINPDGTGLALLSDSWPYDLAAAADAYSKDGRFRVFIKDAMRGGPKRRSDPEFIPILFVYDNHYQFETQLSHFGAGIAFEPAISPDGEHIVLVSNDTRNDEIWKINRDGSGLLQLTWNEWEWDKHPSWSPDGQKIVFWSNRTGHGQIWVMDADGSNLYSLSRTGFNDYDPVWIKYPGIPQYNPLAGSR